MIKLFDYNLTGTGWAEATFTNDNKTVTFEASYLNDPLAELFEALLNLKEGKTENEKVVFVESADFITVEIQLFETESLELTFLESTVVIIDFGVAISPLIFLSWHVAPLIR